MISEKDSQSLLNYVRSRIATAFDPSSLFVEDKNLRENLRIPHKGFYIGVIDSLDENIVREGFLEEDLHNILDSAEKVVENVIRKIRSNSISISKIQTSTFYITTIFEVSYIQNPLHWDENKDGIYFQWGQNYKALYLPYQVKKMNLSKIEVMDRLCCWEAGLAALWRKPEGLCFRMICETFPEV